jgi:hypothetical protein
MFRRNHRDPVIFVSTFMFAMLLLGASSRNAAASTITWEYNLLVHGTALI